MKKYNNSCYLLQLLMILLMFCTAHPILCGW